MINPIKEHRPSTVYKKLLNLNLLLKLIYKNPKGFLCDRRMQRSQSNDRRIPHLSIYLVIFLLNTYYPKSIVYKLACI